MSSTVVVMMVGVAAVLMLGTRRNLRVLVPSWRFFDTADEPPTLWVSSDGGDWKLVAAPRRNLLSWAFAPASNLALAYQSVVDKLVSDVSVLDPETADDDPAITGLASYASVASIARLEVPAGTSLRWKIVNGGQDFVVAAERAA